MFSLESDLYYQLISSASQAMEFIEKASFHTCRQDFDKALEYLEQAKDLVIQCEKLQNSITQDNLNREKDGVCLLALEAFCALSQAKGALFSVSLMFEMLTVESTEK